MKIKKSFISSYNNAELWGGCFDGLKDNHELIKVKFLEEINEFKHPSSPSLLALNLYDTVISFELATLIIESLIMAQPYIRQVAFQGLDRKSKLNIKNSINTSKSNINFALAFFDDFEKAKEWLCQRK